MNRAKDWLAQSERDMEQAQSSAAEGRHEWACFAVQQAAEKAVKALHLAVGQEAWDHVVVEKSLEPFEQRALRWDLSSLPVPAELLVYTVSEWNGLRKQAGRFARMIAQEVVWVLIKE